MSDYQHVPPEIVNESVGHADAKEELLDECESIWRQMEECQSKLTLLGTETLPESDAKEIKSSCSVHILNLMLLVFQILINKLMSTPHEPYLTISDSFWPPYIELLLRYGIALRHPEDPNRIRLEAFHQ
nr:PREDICTED: centromere protein K [Apteryx mantelli mantelli]